MAKLLIRGLNDLMNLVSERILLHRKHLFLVQSLDDSGTMHDTVGEGDRGSERVFKMGVGAAGISSGIPSGIPTWRCSCPGAGGVVR